MPKALAKENEKSLESKKKEARGRAKGPCRRACSSGRNITQNNEHIYRKSEEEEGGKKKKKKKTKRET